MVDVSWNKLIKLYRLATVGKLTNGLIHNINGPLQNLCMDMEMMNLQIVQGKQTLEELIDDVQKRIRRMEQESEQIIQILKATSNRASIGEDEEAYADLNSWVKQELFFLKSDLYFKHNIQTVIDFPEDPVPITRFPQGFALCLSWLIQALVENAEKHKIKSLTIKMDDTPENLSLTLSLEGDGITESFLSPFQITEESIDSQTLKNDHLELSLALMVLKSNGISVTGRSEPYLIHLSLQFPAT